MSHDPAQMADDYAVVQDEREQAQADRAQAPLDVEALKRLVKRHDADGLGREDDVAMLPIAQVRAILAALEERDELRQRVAALEIVLRDTDALMWEWAGETGHDEEPDGTWRPESVREQHVTNGLLLAALADAPPQQDSGAAFERYLAERFPASESRARFDALVEGGQRGCVGRGGPAWLSSRSD